MDNRSKRQRFKDLNKRQSKKLLAPFINIIKPLQNLRKAKLVTPHFSDYFDFFANQSEQEKQAVFKLRHEVYTQECGFFDSDGIFESDQFDDHSLFCLIQHKSSKHVVGAIRLVQSNSDQQSLPIEILFDQASLDQSYVPNVHDRNKICEISRLAVNDKFRRKNIKKKLNQQEHSRRLNFTRKLKNAGYYSKQEIEASCNQFISIALFFATAVMVKLYQKSKVYIIIEPRLAKQLKYAGMKFKKIGPTINYHGERAPFYLTFEQFYKDLPDGFKPLFHNIESSILSHREHKIHFA